MNMKKLKELEYYLKGIDNNPFEWIRIDDGEMEWKFLDFVGTKYCCYNTNWVGKIETIPLEGVENILLSSLTVEKAVLLLVSRSTKRSFEDGFYSNMFLIKQLINGLPTRMDRFKHIINVLWRELNLLVESAGGIKLYVEQNYERLINMLPTHPKFITPFRLTKLSVSGILHELTTGNISSGLAESLISRIPFKSQSKFEADQKILREYVENRRAFQTTKNEAIKL